MESKNYAAAYNELLNRCWEDAAYLEGFRSDPAAALKEYGIPTVEGACYHVVEQTADHIYYIVPKDTTDEKIGELTEQIRKRAGESFTGTVEVIRNTSKDVYVIYYPALRDGELSDDMLGAVAGGRNVDLIGSIDIIGRSEIMGGDDRFYPWNWTAPYHPVL